MAHLELPLPSCDALRFGAHRVFALTDEALFERIGVRVAFTGREGGLSSGPYASLNCASHVGDEPGAVSANRSRLLDALGLADAALVVPKQVHGADLVEVTSRDRALGFAARPPAADAVLVDAPGVAALLNFADCLSLVVVSPSGRFVVVHAGWRGALAHIARLSTCALAVGDKRDSSSFNAYIGPHICEACFEVGPEVACRFADEFSTQANVGPAHISLAKAVTSDLLEAGMRPERIADVRACTFHESERFFSYRAEGGTCGRNAALACRVDLP